MPGLTVPECYFNGVLSDMAATISDSHLGPGKESTCLRNVIPCAKAAGSLNLLVWQSTLMLGI